MRVNVRYIDCLGVGTLLFIITCGLPDGVALETGRAKVYQLDPGVMNIALADGDNSNGNGNNYY